MSLGTGMAAQLRVGLESWARCGEDQGDVVVINEGHEGIVIWDSEHSLTHQLDKASLISDVVDRCVDGDDDLAQLAAIISQLRKGMKGSM